MHKVFHIPKGEVPPTIEKTLLYHSVREPEIMIDMVPKIVDNSLLSTFKFDNVNYVSIFNKYEVNLHNINGTVIKTPKQSILKGWKYKSLVLWRVSLIPRVKILNTEKVLV